MGQTVAVTVTMAAPADAEAVAPLFREYLAFYRRQHDFSALTEFLRERVARGECLLFLAMTPDSGATPVGFALVYPVFSSLGLRRHWILNDLFVLESVRRLGVGRCLLRAVHRQAVISGAGSVQLETAQDNRKARGLYESEGYRREQEFLLYRCTLPAD
jgi:GNAT superfamily N-acetyltransferase